MGMFFALDCLPMFSYGSERFTVLLTSLFFEKFDKFGGIDKMEPKSFLGSFPNLNLFVDRKAAFWLMVHSFRSQKHVFHTM